MKTDACITKKNLNLHISCAKHLLADRKMMFLDMLCSKMQFVDNWKQQLRASVWQLLLCQTFQSWRPTAVELQCRCRTPRIPPNCLAWRGSARGVSSASFHSLWTCRKECGTFPGAPAPSAPAHHRDGWGGANMKRVTEGILQREHDFHFQLVQMKRLTFINIGNNLKGPVGLCVEVPHWAVHSKDEFPDKRLFS